MDDIIDLIATDQKASEVTDKIKDLLYTKAADRVDAMKPEISAAMFNPSPDQPEVEQEVSDEPIEQEET
tara:strand:- start:1025 stop:1231 length:207 start_codon:yes stop_codon:yes gene_type:complete